MSQPSFRLRIALLSSLLAGAALVGFGAMSWGLIYQAKLNRIDDAIKNHLIGDAKRPRSEMKWESYSSKLPITFHTNSPTDLAILVQTAAGKTLYQSPTWTTELSRHTVFAPRSAELFPPTNRQPPPADRSASSTEQPPPFPPTNGEPPPEDLSAQLTEQPPPFPPINGKPPPADRSAQLSQPKTIGTWRVHAMASSHVRIAIAMNLQTIEPEMSGIRNAYLVSIPTLLVSIAIGAWLLSGNALAPIREVTQTLRQVTVKGLDRRVSVSGIDGEFVELLAVFNQMMARLERSFSQASRFSADAAHELKTPLSILQGELEQALQSAPPGSDLQQRLSSFLDEVRHLSTIVRKLLLLSLADAGQMQLTKTAVDLSELLTDLASDIELISPDLTVQMEIASGLNIPADRPLLIQVLHNLIGNATKYNLPAGWVRIEAGYQDRLVVVKISNRSNDIPASERAVIFDRFYRGDPARNKQVEGLGLGLSLAREIVYAHGGDLTLDPTPTGQTGFTLTLPRQLVVKVLE
ncbi:ATP-binding protein [Chamaesiphon sp. OTE_75_metabat_556]|uniref:sensor histidine kinase n=1 Tax=Chamaesiphon sp. OTE_75_metabat_556 TaxID=2964692 RepID=UPI00286BC565|nr:ATP-binding protein [Chamaesiphon sp. OTE_75_metabat_556]